MRSIVLGLLISLSLPVFAELEPTIDPPKPAPTQKPHQQKGKPVGSIILKSTPEFVEQANDEERKLCAELVVELSNFKLDSDNLAKLREEKLAVDAALAEDISKQYRIYGVSELRAIKRYWRVIMLIARGDTRELLPLLRPIFGAVYTNANIMVTSLAEQKRLRTDTDPKNAEQNAKDLKAEKEKYVAAARLFGANYPDFIRFKRILKKTIDSEPIEDAGDAAEAAGKPEEKVVLLHMSTKRAKDAAQSAMNILTSPFEQQWLVSSTKTVMPDSVISTLYIHSLDAKLGFEKKNLEEQKGSRNIFLKGVQLAADFYLNLTDRSWVPEKYRMWILRAMGVAYRSLMMERYLDKIEAVVNSMHAIDANGDFVMETDKQTLELAMKTMREFRNTGVGNDYLKTFALLGWRTDEWIALKKFVKAKAEATKDESTAFTKLYADMLDAEKSRESMPEYTFAYDPATRHELIFVGTQVAYLLAQEEFWRRWGIDWFHQAANYFF